MIVEKLQKIIEGIKSTSSEKKSSEIVILSYIINKTATIEEIEVFIEKQIERNKTSEDKLVAAAKFLVKKKNRKLRIFSSFDEKHEFEKTHEIGQSWSDENGNICAYEY